jgi:intraflagellar transport protein 172
MHKWEETVKVAEKSHHGEVEELKSNYYTWLLDSGQ